MRISPLAVVLLAAPLTPAASQQKVDIRMRTIPAVSVRLGGAISSIRVIGWDRDSVTLTGTLSFRAREIGQFSPASRAASSNAD